MEWVRSDGYLVTDDQERLDLVRIHHWLSDESYWAAGRSVDLVEKSVRSSITLGCFAPDGVPVGVSRLVTDGATFAWLCDVFVDKDFRGRGLGRFLVQSAVNHPEVKDLDRILLATGDAHDLYRQFGFISLTEPQRWMELRSATRSPAQAVDESGFQVET
jgi:GNAT superfamily N-acetyltransferase